MHLLVSTHNTPIAVVEIDSSCAVNRIHATHFWETMLSTLASFIECGNGSDLGMGLTSEWVPLPYLVHLISLSHAGGYVLDNQREEHGYVLGYYRAP
jgi:hypothetical protein